MLSRAMKPEAVGDDIDSDEEERIFLDEISGAAPVGDDLNIDDLQYRETRASPIGAPIEDDDDYADAVFEGREVKPIGVHGGGRMGSRLSSYHRGGMREMGRYQGRMGARMPHHGGEYEDRMGGEYMPHHGEEYKDRMMDDRMMGGRMMGGRMMREPMMSGRMMEEPMMHEPMVDSRTARGRRRNRGRTILNRITGGRGMRRYPRGRGEYPRISGAAAVAEKAGYSSQVYYDKFEHQPVENLGNDIYDGDVPVAYSALRIPFRKETTLAEAASLRSGHQITVPLQFGKSVMAKTIAESGAYLGDVSIKNLRHNAPVSLAVRCECKPAGSVMPGVNLRAPNSILSDAAHPVHGVLSKRTPVGSGFDFKARDVQAVRDTWLSDPKYRGQWSVDNIHKGISQIGGSSKVSLVATHPVADLLHQRGLLSEQDLLQGDDMAVVEGQLVDDALGELKSQEHGNSFFKNAQDLQLVFHRAYGRDDKQIGKPAMTDTTELLDNVVAPPSKGAQSEMIERRLNQPFVIEGEWEVSFGKPIALEDDSVNEGELEDERMASGEDVMYGEAAEERGTDIGAHMHSGMSEAQEEYARQQEEHEAMMAQEEMANID